jgi:transcriptional antiterminator RfaH
MQQWYALFTKPRAEYQVEQVLQSRDIETYLPSVPVWRARRRRMETEPLFAGYLFTKICLDEVGISEIAWTPGLRHIVGAAGGDPPPVPNEVIAFIRRRVATLDPQRPGANLRPGDPVTVTDGPLKELEAVFEQHLSGLERAQILVRVLGRLTRYTVPLDWLKQQ